MSGSRKVLDFLILRSAFSQRNVTSVLLVAIFFGMYVMSGGKVTTSLPHLKDPTAFGNAGAVDPSTSVSVANPREVLGLESTEEQMARQRTVSKMGRLFDPEIDAEKEGDIDKRELMQVDSTNEKEELKLRKFERRERDSLAAIEERLKIKRAPK